MTTFFSTSCNNYVYEKFKATSNDFFLNVLPTTRSTAYSKSALATFFFLSLAACSAASLQILAISAPLNPGVRNAKFREYFAGVSSKAIPFRCCSKICLRSSKSGRSIKMCLSNRPGLNKA